MRIYLVVLIVHTLRDTAARSHHVRELFYCDKGKTGENLGINKEIPLVN